MRIYTSEISLQRTSCSFVVLLIKISKALSVTVHCCTLRMQFIELNFTANQLVSQS